MFNQAIEIIKTLKANSFQAVFAGGFVRDKVMGLESHDIDVATSALPEQVEALFDKTLAVGKAFGVIVVVTDGIEIEVATFRKDSNESDGRRPDSVSFTSIEEDAKRRDLTINGMFYDPIEDQIIDFVGGQKDIENKIVRFIGDPEQRISEDKLRMMRVVRFASRFGFNIDPDTFNAVKNHAREISVVSVERIGEEMVKIMQARQPRIALNLLMDTGLMDCIFPEIKALKGCEQPAEFHPEGDCFEHTILASEKLPENASDELLFATLFHDVGKPPTQTFEDRIRFSGHDMEGAKITETVLKRLKFSNEFTERVVSMVANHMKFMCVKEMRTSRLKRFLGLPNFDEHLSLHRADCLSSHEGLENYDFVVEKLNTFTPEEIRPPRLVTGLDLIGMGYVQGRELGRVLKEIEEKQLEGEINDRDSALKYAVMQVVV